MEELNFCKEKFNNLVKDVQEYYYLGNGQEYTFTLYYQQKNIIYEAIK